MRYDAVIFDLDGTLTDSEPGIVNCVQYAIEKMGFPVPQGDALKKFIGPPLLTAFEEYCGMTEAQSAQALLYFRERFNPIGWKENSVFEGIAPLLRTLKKRGVHVALATSKPEEFAQRIMNYFGLTPYVCVISAAPMVETHHASKKSLIAAALPAHYERACMVGDRLFDVEGAKQNGIDSVGVLYGYGTREELSAAGADYLAATVDDLRDYLLAGEAPERGFFLSFEGGDGCGKSTQIDRAATRLAQCGWKVHVSREPGGCPISERIREIILDVKSEGMCSECEALLYAAARAQHVREVILPALEKGELVLCDRFMDSSLVYQGGARGLGRELVETINRPATQGLQPDLTLFYDLEPSVGMVRRAQASELDRLEREDALFFQSVHAAYQQLARENPQRIETVDASRTIEEVAAETHRHIMQLLGR